MAKAAKTVKKTENPDLRQIGERVLARYPDKEEVYVCANGFTFFEHGAAAECAARLKDSSIITIKK